MVYGELGRYPLDICIKLRIIKYWAKLVTGKQDKLLVIMFKLAFRKHENDFLWLSFVKQTLDECGLSYLWNDQSVVNIPWLNANLKQILTDQFKQLWLSDIQNSSKTPNCRIFKNELKLENYFNILSYADFEL